MYINFESFVFLVLIWGGNFVELCGLFPCDVEGVTLTNAKLPFYKGTVVIAY